MNGWMALRVGEWGVVLGWTGLDEEQNSVGYYTKTCLIVDLRLEGSVHSVRSTV